MMQGNTDRNLSRTLQQSLQEVLMEVSMEGNRMGPPPVSASRNFLLNQNIRRLSGLGNMPGLTSSNTAAASSLFSTPSSFAGFGGSVGASQFRPSEAFAGLSTEDLLLSAATGKRMFEQSQDLARQQALAEKTYERRLRYKQSLLALMKGESTGNTDLFGGGNTTGSNLLQQSYQHMFFNKQPPVPPVASRPTLPPSETKTAIKVLGTSLRKKDSPYLDVSVLQDPDTSDKRTRGGVTEPFPEKLHRMLKEVEDEGKSDIIGFFPHGRAFAVHDPDRFIAEIMPKYFKQSRLSSFQRQLNLYGFTRILSGPDAGGYYHELFLWGRPSLAVHMRRVGLPQGEDRRKMRAKNLKAEPDFYAMGNVATAVVNIPGMPY